MREDYLPSHGGQLRELAAEFNVPEASLLDFSASIHPHPPSDALVASLCDSIRAHKIISVYPEMHYSALKEAISAYANVALPTIAIGSGVMPLLSAVLCAFRPRRCLVPVPAFAEYRKILEVCGVECCALTVTQDTRFSLDIERITDELKATKAQALLLANPQSPSGRLMRAERVLELYEAVYALGATTILDEAFIDYVPEESMSSWAARLPGLIVLRSLTKFFAMPGLRVAYAVACPEMRFAIEACVPAWSVASIASEAARIALQDCGAIEATRRLNALERDWLANRLQSLGLCVFQSAANFLLVKIDEMRNGLELWRRLIIEHRVVLRSCANFEGLNEHYFRIGIRTRPQNELLVQALKEVLHLMPKT